MNSNIEPVMIDAALVSAQRRKRLFWVGKWNGKKYETVPIPQPEDREILLKDILESGAVMEEMMTQGKSHAVTASYNGAVPWNSIQRKQRTIIGKDEQSVYQYRRTYWRETKGGKVPTLTAAMGTGGNNVPYVSQRPRGKNKEGKHFEKSSTVSTSSFEHNHSVNDIRKLTPIECERLQGLPDKFTEGISNSQRYKCLGNAFNVDVVVHILKHIWL